MRLANLMLYLAPLLCSASITFCHKAVAQATHNILSEKQAAYESTIFAGGCFWCMEPPFDKTRGVIDTQSGYSGGNIKNPNYKQVTQGTTGHYEVVKVTYDPKMISYEELLSVFWRNVDPLDSKGQFCDKGQQYLSAIFYRNDKEKNAALKSLEGIKTQLNNQKIATQILPEINFYPAENYHQNYYQKNPLRYKYYRHACKRDKRLKKLWGKSK